MYWNGAFCLDLWDNDATYAVFDDWPDWSKFLSYKQFLGAQREFILTDKYRKKFAVKWGRPSIIVANILPVFDDLDWINENCIIVEIKNKLY